MANPLRALNGGWFSKIKSIWNVITKVVVEGFRFCEFVAKTWQDRERMSGPLSVGEGVKTISFNQKVVDGQMNYDRVKLMWSEYISVPFRPEFGQNMDKFDLCCDMYVYDSSEPPASMAAINDPVQVDASSIREGLVLPYDPRTMDEKWVCISKIHDTELFANNQSANTEYNVIIAARRNRKWTTQYRFRIDMTWNSVPNAKEDGVAIIQPSIVLENGKLTEATHAGVGININRTQ